MSVLIPFCSAHLMGLLVLPCDVRCFCLTHSSMIGFWRGWSQPSPSPVWSRRSTSTTQPMLSLWCSATTGTGTSGWGSWCTRTTHMVRGCACVRGCAYVGRFACVGGCACVRGCAYVGRFACVGGCIHVRGCMSGITIHACILYTSVCVCVRACVCVCV